MVANIKKIKNYKAYCREIESAVFIKPVKMMKITKAEWEFLIYLVRLFAVSFSIKFYDNLLKSERYKLRQKQNSKLTLKKNFGERHWHWSKIFLISIVFFIKEKEAVSTENAITIFLELISDIIPQYRDAYNSSISKSIQRAIADCLSLGVTRVYIYKLSSEIYIQISGIPLSVSDPKTFERLNKTEINSETNSYTQLCINKLADAINNNIRADYLFGIDLCDSKSYEDFHTIKNKKRSADIDGKFGCGVINYAPSLNDLMNYFNQNP
jgi:hypothetical protein